MRVLVTGGAGFIGSNLVRHLREHGHDVLALDDLSLGRASYVPTGLCLADVRQPLMRRLAERTEGIVHLASRSSVTMYYPDPVEGLDIATRGFVNVMNVARETGARVVYASTSSLYSRQRSLPNREDAPVVAGSFYEVGKLHNEEVARLYHERWDIASAGLRFFAVYGPREEHKGEYANIVTQFLWAMRKGQRPRVYGDGEQTRDFTYVGDVVEAIRLALESREHGVFNVGTGKAASFLQVASLLNEALGTALEPELVPNPVPNYVQQTQADTARARLRLNFTARVALLEGIRASLRYYGERQNDAHDANAGLSRPPPITEESGVPRAA